MRKTYIIGGGTFNHIRNHLSLAAPAFGTTAKLLHKEFLKFSFYNQNNTVLKLTKMADSSSDLITNLDLTKYITKLVKDPTTGTIILNAAICDYEASSFQNINNGSHATRLKTKKGDIDLKIHPSLKIANTIRAFRPDIFLVTFKTTTGVTVEEQYYTALQHMKTVKSNIVLANDVITRKNMIIVPEESAYCITSDRNKILNKLANIIQLRQNLTYNETKFKSTKNVDISKTSTSFQKVLKFLVDNKAFVCDNNNNFTPGHFCYKESNNIFFSSQRKTDHNNVFEQGLTMVLRNKDNTISAFGTKKPSVGATSQRLLFDMNPDMDCIIHTHNPLLPGSKINQIEQYPYQCGSIECGQNTLKGLRTHEKGKIKAVYLKQHGANIMFSSNINPNIVINFIKNNLDLAKKVNWKNF